MTVGIAITPQMVLKRLLTGASLLGEYVTEAFLSAAAPNACQRGLSGVSRGQPLLSGKSTHLISGSAVLRKLALDGGDALGKATPYDIGIDLNVVLDAEDALLLGSAATRAW